MRDEVAVRRWDGPEGGRQLEVFLFAYEEVYVEPPYGEGPRDVVEFADRFREQAGSRAGFRVVVAWQGPEVVGFTYGYRLPADTGWWRGMVEPVDASLVAETGRRTFAVIELAVRKPWRRGGVARRLHATLTEGMGVERLTLCVRPEPEAAPARAAYAAWGYGRVGASRPWGEAPLYDVLLRPCP